MHFKNLHYIYRQCRRSLIYSMTPGSLWNYYRDENEFVNDNASDGKSFV